MLLACVAVFELEFKFELEAEAELAKGFVGWSVVTRWKRVDVVSMHVARVLPRCPV